jgi:hypothetical protein
MALNKKASSWPCFVHVAIYTASVMLFTQWPWWAAIVVFMPHFAIDRSQFVAWWMATVRQPKFMEPPMSPWSRIAVDNTWHVLCLWLTQKLVEGLQ